MTVDVKTCVCNETDIFDNCLFVLNFLITKSPSPNEENSEEY